MTIIFSAYQPLNAFVICVPKASLHVHSNVKNIDFFSLFLIYFPYENCSCKHVKLENLVLFFKY